MNRWPCFVAIIAIVGFACLPIGCSPSAEAPVDPTVVPPTAVGATPSPASDMPAEPTPAAEPAPPAAEPKAASEATTPDAGPPPLEAPKAAEPAPAPEPPKAEEGKAAPPAPPAEEPKTSMLLNPALLMASLAEVVPAENQAPGPHPKDYLWQAPSGDVPADEPVAVEVPLGLEPLDTYVPRANPITKAKLELGRQLYFDPRLSKDGTVSCATCHNPEKGWTDQMATSTGINGQKGGRSAPSVLNTVYGKTMFWDGRAPSLEGQSQGPPLNPIEMGYANYEELVGELRKIPGYKEQFQKVFGTDVTLDGIAKAIATFERTALSGNSKFDKYMEGEIAALSESEKRGMTLFGLRLNVDDEFDPGVTLQKGKCSLCHVGFNFTDEEFHNLGVGYNEQDKAFADLGRWGVTPIGAKDREDLGAFKTPTVRDIVNTAPYMHDGSEATLEEVVAYYDMGGIPNPSLDEDMKPLGLTDGEKADLVAFMKALTGEPRPVEVPKLPEGPDGKAAPDARAALTPPPVKTTQALQMHGLLAR